MLQAAESKVQLLDTQYRMHPAIAAFPSEHFYGGQLRNAEGMAEATRRPWHEHAVSAGLASISQHLLIVKHYQRVHQRYHYVTVGMQATHPHHEAYDM